MKQWMCVFVVLAGMGVGVQAQTFPTSHGLSGMFETGSARTEGAGNWTAALVLENYDYLTAPARSLRPPSRRPYRDQDLDTSELRVALSAGLTARWEAAVSVPYVRTFGNAGDLAGYERGYPYVGKVNDYSMGDAEVATKFALIPVRDGRSGLALSAFVDLPVGRPDNGITSGQLRWGTDLHWQKRGMVASVGWARGGVRQAEDTPLSTRFTIADEVHLDLGYTTPSRWNNTDWINEIDGTFFEGGTSNPAERIYTVNGVRHRFGRSHWSVDAGLRINVPMALSANHSHPIGGVLALDYQGGPSFRKSRSSE